MPPEQRELAVTLTRFVDDHQPGVVECEFRDAEQRRHRVIDKVPMFVDAPLDAQSIYPCAGIIRCEVIERWADANGRDLVRITTDRPDAIESVDGLSEFIVLVTQL